MTVSEKAIVPQVVKEEENPFPPAVKGEVLGKGAIEAARAQQEVQAAVILAKRFPRDEASAYTRIMQACKRPKLAKEALYSFPRGKDEDGKKVNVMGPSIRLAEVMAQAWGNLDFGVREVGRNGDMSDMEAYCWDMETNVRSSRAFQVPHVRFTKQGKKHLEDPRDIYEMTANQGSRRMRAAILQIIPSDVKEAAVEQVRKTIAAGDGEPIETRIKKMVFAFAELQVPKEALEKRLGHSVDLTTPDELVDLTAVHRALADHVAKREDYFALDGMQNEKTKAMNDKLGAQTEES